jgi:hypothetical protein
MACGLKRCRRSKLQIRFVTTVDAGILGPASPLEMPKVVAVPYHFRARQSILHGNILACEGGDVVYLHLRNVTLP